MANVEQFHGENSEAAMLDQALGQFQEQFPAYAGTVSHPDASEIFLYKGKDEKSLPSIRLASDRGRLSISIGTIRIIQEEGQHPDAPSDRFQKHGNQFAVTPIPRFDIDVRELWQPSQIEEAIDLTKRFQESLIVTPAFLEQAASWSAEEDRPLTFRDFIVDRGLGGPHLLKKEIHIERTTMGERVRRQYDLTSDEMRKLALTRLHENPEAVATIQNQTPQAERLIEEQRRSIEVAIAKLQSGRYKTDL